MRKKSKLGCSTCRVRKVKCDETRPICRRCSTSGRRCEGPFRSKFVYVDPREHHGASTSKLPHGQQPQIALSDPEFDPFEARTFQYFLQRVAPAVGRDLDEEFWTTFLPRFSDSNRAIRHAILTISHLHEYPQVQIWKRNTLAKSRTNTAFAWYAHSLSAFRTYLAGPEDSVNHQLALLSCILFTNIESQQNNAANACRLLQCGLSLIKRAKAEPGKIFIESDTATKTILEIFSRQRVLLALYGYPLPGNADETSRSWERTTGSSLDTLTEARADLFRCLDDTVSLARAARTSELRTPQSQHDQTLFVRQRRTLEALEVWHHNFLQQAGAKEVGPSSGPNATSTILLIYYELARIWVITCLKSHESATDGYMDCFARILDLAERVTMERQRPNALSADYSPELGTIASLFMVGWKCRDRNMRRKAVDLLLKGPEQESLYRADIHARALRKIIEIEEESTDISTAQGKQVLEIWLPSETARIRNLTVHYETWEGVKVQPCLIFDMSTYGLADSSNSVQRKAFL